MGNFTSETTSSLNLNHIFRTSVLLTGMSMTGMIFGKCNNLHEATARTIDTLKLIVNKHAPLKHVSRSKQKQLQNLGSLRECLNSFKLNMLRTKPTTYLKTPSKLVSLKTTQTG